jgi:ABC-2 type transport system permease protein
MRFASFVPAQIVGISGTFFAVVATSAKRGVFMPRQMPVNILASEAWRMQAALGLGGGVGLIVLILAAIHLARREVL